MKPSSLGQALIEYLFILSLVVILGGRMIKAFTRYAAEGMGTLNSVLSSHLTVGVCKEECFPDNYINGNSL
ncbi:MAG: hypothetical protein OXB88_00690 [Bacteriovoracales bacterium]|nr:hypothetical protein [Bacteriovoracales bacterium]